ncbi:fimbrial protein [Halomonas cupida]|uniref:Fimbrial protein n=1 Tax=Halomonas cupida TaxID=44933 RepID=A0A1M7GEB5_9GAMM|nr:fimbrial protein [Halomonas cupida]GEN23773.1 fimbrial protein [Halomonas cupida]SHM14633.1 major type 1 subunit fimbrin (pilin) [Halomonas cupida]
MKKALTVTAFIAASLATSMGALASDGTIIITGQVTDSACQIAVNGGDADASVVLPTVSTSSLAADGDVAGTTPIVMSLSGCPSTGHVRAYFEPQNVDVATGYLINNAKTGAAANVQVQVLNAIDGSAIDLRNNEGNNSVDFVDDGDGTTGSATLNYAAQYIAVNGAASAGDVETALVYTLDYL